MVPDLALQRKSHAHRGAAFVAHIVGCPVVHKGRSGALVQFGFAHEQVDLPAILLVANDASALGGFRFSCVLGLPVEGVFI